jgi:hypothetical protein
MIKHVLSTCHTRSVCIRSAELSLFGIIVLRTAQLFAWNTSDIAWYNGRLHVSSASLYNDHTSSKILTSNEKLKLICLSVACLKNWSDVKQALAYQISWEWVFTLTESIYFTVFASLRLSKSLFTSLYTYVCSHMPIYVSVHLRLSMCLHVFTSA